MFYAIRMAKKIAMQKNSNILFSFYTDAMLKVLNAMKKEQYNRSFDFNKNMDVIVEAVSTGKLVNVDIVQKNAPKGETVEINFMLHSSYYKSRICVEIISPDFMIESAV